MLGYPIKRATAAQKIGGFDMVLWTHDNDNEVTIMCYPEAKQTGNTPFSPKQGKTFCLPLSRFNGNGMEVWDNLLNGNARLEDLTEYFWEPVKHSYALGIQGK